MDCLSIIIEIIVIGQQLCWPSQHSINNVCILILFHSFILNIDQSNETHNINTNDTNLWILSSSSSSSSQLKQFTGQPVLDFFSISAADD
ncbi:hypothetical protein DERF_003294 [Dermatophagoides farinae]|uniref:Uncharacterized protein n=1 Tax=Dermatophagoides farinae TaxID=6954 RepID=A0A922LCG8_DERFA|nr:hypothetical protein DERF_003294 [Dermatophagoides farinae]